MLIFGPQIYEKNYSSHPQINLGADWGFPRSVDQATCNAPQMTQSFSLV